MLNDKLDPLLRRIRIAHPEPEEPFYFTENSEPEMKYFEEEYFLGNSAYSYDFGVYIPLALQSADMDNIVYALLNKYKIITKEPLIFYV